MGKNTGGEEVIMFKYETYQAWQCCPVCAGLGKIPTQLTNTVQQCTVCKGEKIIAAVNGLPPSLQGTLTQEGK